MKIQFILITLINFFGFCINAQEIEWQKSLGGTDFEYATSIQQTTDGGYIVAGRTQSGNGDVTGHHGLNDYWIVKLNQVGVLEWQKCYGGDGSDEASSVLQIADGGYIVAGSTNSDDGDVLCYNGDNDFWILKLDPIGNLEWQKCLGGSSSERASSIQNTADGGYIIAGTSSSEDGDVTENNGLSDFWIVKIDSLGNLIWQKSLGGSDQESASSVAQTSDGGYIVAGTTESNDGDVSGNHGGSDYWVVKLDLNGDLVWQKTLGGAASDRAGSILQTTDDNYVVAGTTTSFSGDVTGNHGSSDFWVVKLDAIGNIVWQKCRGGTDWDIAGSIEQTTDQGFIVAGSSLSTDGEVTGHHFGYDFWIVKLNSEGNLAWQKSLGGSWHDGAGSIQQTTDGGYIVAGYSGSQNGDVTSNNGFFDYWVVKLGPGATSVFNPESGLEIKIYPNPASDIIILESEKVLINHFISISTIDGKLVYRHRYGSANQFSIDVSSLPTGIYLLDVQSEVHGQTEHVTKKIFIE